MTFTAFVERHARSIILVGIAMALAGMVSAITLPVGLFPQVAFPASSSTWMPAAVRRARPPCW